MCTYTKKKSEKLWIVCVGIEKSMTLSIKYGTRRDAPDTTVFAGYPANQKAGYRISGRIFVFTNIFWVKYKINLF
jgi:hypothetical protein